MRTGTQRRTRPVRRAVATAVGAALATWQTAAAQLHAPDFIYDTTAGLAYIYTGDLDSGVMTFHDIDGRNFRVQRLGSLPDVDNGFFGAGPGPASFFASIHLLEFVDNTPVGSGSGDVAVFAGDGSGSDVVITDEQGNTIEANVVRLELTDNTSSPVRPGWEGAAELSALTFSGVEFQRICAQHVGSAATAYTFTFVIEQAPSDPVTVEEYLASGGLGGLHVEMETLEVRVGGSQCWGDLDGDNDIDQADLSELLAAYEVDDGGDLDCDGDTDQSDLGLLLANYGLDCP